MVIPKNKKSKRNINENGHRRGTCKTSVLQAAQKLEFMIIQNKKLRILYFANIILIILAFIFLLAVSLIRNPDIYQYDIYQHSSLLLLLYCIIVLIGTTLGLSFFILNLIVLVKYKKVIFFIISILLLIWVIDSYHFMFFGVLP
jgi:hypothetical protein